MDWFVNIVSRRSSGGVAGDRRDSYESLRDSPECMNQDSIHYEELLKDAVPCPTCKGLGRVARDQQNELVALIPMSDSRLSPSRTGLWVGLTIVLCFIIAGLTLFFLIPRSVSMQPGETVIQPFNITYNKDRAVFEFDDWYEISNGNFFAISMSGLNVTLTYRAPSQDGTIVTWSLGEGTNMSVYSVPAKGTFKYWLALNGSVNNNQQWFLYDHCVNPNAYRLIQMWFEATVQYSTLGSQNQMQYSSERYLNCQMVNSSEPISAPPINPEL